MGMKKRRTTYLHSTPPSNMVEFIVMINRPSHKKLEGLDRVETYKLLKSNSVKRKNEIMAWIKAEGLETEVFKIEQPTVFNMLFITCTPKVVECLENSESVMSVKRNPTFSVELTDQ